MEKIKATAYCTFKVDEINHLNELIERDKAKPLVEEQLVENGVVWKLCPSCRHIISSKCVFCEECGQRLDYENIAL